MGGATRGVWKTVNGGTSWTPVFDAAGTLSIGALAVDGNDPNVVWVGTGERQWSCWDYFGLGLFRSGDGGASFQARNGSGADALQLSYGGVWKTTDGASPGGACWPAAAATWSTSPATGHRLRGHEQRRRVQVHQRRRELQPGPRGW